MWDVDGNEYIDFNMCFGALNVGHAHPLLIEEMKAQMEKGMIYTMPHEETALLAQEITRRFPVDMVRFTNSGTESTMHAIRLARGCTGKDKIIKMEGCYHGGHDYVLVSVYPPEDAMGPSELPTAVPAGLGIPEGTFKNTIVVPYNNIQALQKVIDKHRDEIAAVIMEPVPMNMCIVSPKDSFLEKIRRITQENNILLIFDEVKSGARVTPGGVCEYFNIKPDLVCLGKSIGGGLPLGAFGGRREIMSKLTDSSVLHSGTYSSNPLAIKAGLVTLTKILTPEAYDYLNKIGDMLAEGYRRVITEFDFPAHVKTIGPIGMIVFSRDEVENYRGFMKVSEKLWYKYWVCMLNNGIIPCHYGKDGHWTLAVQHTEEDIENHIKIFRRVAPSLSTE